MRSFETNGLAALCAVCLLYPAVAMAEIQADAVYTNGKIYTLDRKSSVVSAVAVLDGRFLTIGSVASVKSYIGPNTKVIDLAGAPVVPGLNDSHIHTVWAGEGAVRVQLLDVKTVADALARIKAFAATRKPGEWILGGTWLPNSQLAEHRYLTAVEIDSVAPNNPVALPGHVSSFNSAAMKIAGVDRNTPNPDGGVIEKDDAGNPTGIFQELASRLVTQHIPAPSQEELEQRYLLAMKVANAYGLTSVLDPGLVPLNIRVLQRLMLSHRMTLRYSVMYKPDFNASQERWAEATNGIGISSGSGNEWLRIDAIGEMPVDGGMTYRTAFTRDAYPGDPNYHGVAAMTAEHVNSNVSIGNKNDWRFSIHAVGDAAIDRVLDAYEAADKEKSIAGRRFSIEHGSLIRRDQLERMKKLGVILQLQNAFLWEKGPTIERNLGKEVAHRVIPNRMAIDILGINNVSSGTDYQGNLMNPWTNIYLAVTRKDSMDNVYGADQAISREEALRLYTVSGAYGTFEEAIKGSIESGKLADMVVLDRDYFTVPVEEIKDIKPVETIVGGNIVYHR